MIKFRCTGCQKAIGVDEKYGGRLIKCPACKNPTRVPKAAVDEPPVAQAVPVAESVTQRAVEATAAHIPKVPRANPICPSCQTELFNPSDTMCGVCGHLLQQQPVVASPAPMSPRPAAATSNIAQIPPLGVNPATVPPLSPISAAPTGYGEMPEYDLPVNPAVGGGSTYSQPMASKEDGYDSSYHYDVPKKGPSSGKSVGAWVAAVAIGMFLALIWGVIASFTGAFGQVFAWAIGAIVGLIAGLIARSPSIPFCLATAGGALLCMLFGRVVSAWVIMMAVSAMASFNTFLMPDTGVTIGVMEDMNANGEFEGDEKALADMRVEAYFTNKDIYEVGGYDEIEYEVEVALDQKVRRVVKEMSKGERRAILKKVRESHPEWMEETWYFNAILDSMVEAGEIEDEGLLAHANVVLAQIDGESDEDYYQDTPQRQLTKRDEELRKLVMKRFAEMDVDQRAEAIRNARINHPVWTPVHHEFLAMLDTMYAAGDIPAEQKKRAQSEIKLNLKLEYDDIDTNDIYENLEDEDYDYEKEAEKERKEANELQALVNTELMKRSQDEIDQLVDSTCEKYPKWKPTSGLALLDDLSEGVDEAIAKFDSDGTFWGSLKTRFRTLDFVWLLLGMLSAFAIAFTLGQAGKKKS